jgi:hypothetical protein
MPTSIERHAVYATAKLNVKDPRARGGVRVESVCFRVGQHGRVRHARRWYRIDFYEVRSTDRHGRGLGSERHATALPVPYRAHRA